MDHRQEEHLSASGSKTDKRVVVDLGSTEKHASSEENPRMKKDPAAHMFGNDLCMDICHHQKKKESV